MHEQQVTQCVRHALQGQNETTQFYPCQSFCIPAGIYVTRHDVQHTKMFYERGGGEKTTKYLVKRG